MGVMGALAAVSIAATVAGGVMQARSQQQAAAAQAQQAHYAAAVARNNQIASEYAAQEAEERGRAEETAIRIAARKTSGSQRTALAAAGVDVGSGTALDLTSETAGLAQADILMARHNAEREALGFRNQGAGFGAESQLRTNSGRSALKQGQLAAQGTLLTTAGSVASKWYGMA